MSRKDGAMKFIIFLPIILLVACSSMIKSAKVDECYRNQWHSGLWRVSQIGEDQLTLVEITAGQESLERIKVVGPWYGGWNPETCPNIKKNWSTPVNQ